MNARKDGWSGIGKVLTNPYMWGSYGIYKGVDWIRDTPEAIRYVLEDAGGQRRITTHLGLAKIARKTSYSKVINFVSNANEFKAMEFFTKNKPGGISRLKKLITTVEDRKKNKKQPTSFINRPVITQDNLKEAGLDAEFYSQVSNDEQTPRMRYLFYKQFLSDSTNVNELQNNCLKWM